MGLAVAAGATSSEAPPGPPPIKWDGPQPATVVGGPWGTEDSQLVNVNVTIDAVANAAVLKAFRERADGNTFTSIPLYEPLTEEQRQELRDSGVLIWAEWPPVPKPIPMVPREQYDADIQSLTEQIDALTARVAEIAASAKNALADGRSATAVRLVVDHISNDGSDIRQRVCDVLDGKACEAKPVPA